MVLIQAVHDGAAQFLTMFSECFLLLVGWLAKRVSDTVAARVHDARAAAIIERAQTLATAVVKDVYMAYVAPFKESGRFGAEEKARAKAAAMEKFRAHLGERGLKELAWVIGGGAQAPADIVLSTYLEAAIHDNKQHGLIAKGVTVTSVPLDLGPSQSQATAA